jgi:asparagine synthase (glutamine-hydrolysing)
MCGIAGEVRFDDKASSPAVVKAMCDVQRHRGPDDEGYYQKGPVALGIRRLSIIDLSKGLYPLQNETGTLHLVYNGEIYGFQEMRADLENLGHRFRSNTDGETIVHSYEQWGTQCLDRLDGMFAFALWDESKQILWVARDPFGIKPFYYFRNEDFFAFASEIKPILNRADVSYKPNDEVIQEYLLSGLVDVGEETFFSGIRRLGPGHQMLIRPNGSIEVKEFWRPSISHQINGKVSDGEVDCTRNLFMEAVKLQLISDVPVGTCLSGGVDSSSIVCAIKKVYPKGVASIGERLKTFSAIFPGEPFDEAEYAQDICSLTGAEHNAVRPTAEEFWSDLPTLVRCQEEPFFSTSIYAQWRVMKQAKERGITVLLDGQGGDELLGGYHPYYQYYLLNLIRERSFSKFVNEGVRSRHIILPILVSYLKSVLSRVVKQGDQGSTRASRDLILRNRDPKQGVKFSDAPRNDLALKLQIDVAAGKLPALLRYEDKNSMWYSIEARVPFLHRHFFEYVASLPFDRKLRNGFTKYVFRLAMADILPDKVRLRRDKIGFETPERKWIEALRKRLVEFFSASRVCAGRYYDAEALLRLLSKRTFTNEEIHLIWRILNLEIWYNQFFGESRVEGDAVNKKN